LRSREVHETDDETVPIESGLQSQLFFYSNGRDNSCDIGRHFPNHGYRRNKGNCAILKFLVSKNQETASND